MNGIDCEGSQLRGHFVSNTLLSGEISAQHWADKSPSQVQWLVLRQPPLRTNDGKDTKTPADINTSEEMSAIAKGTATVQNHLEYRASVPNRLRA